MTCFEKQEKPVGNMPCRSATRQLASEEISVWAVSDCRRLLDQFMYIHFREWSDGEGIEILVRESVCVR